MHISTYESTQRASGTYLQIYDLFLKHESNEELIQAPEGASNVLASFVTPAAFPDKIKYLFSSDESTVFTFY